LTFEIEAVWLGAFATQCRESQPPSALDDMTNRAYKVRQIVAFLVVHALQALYKIDKYQ